jgi:hypothetical protein
MELKFTIGPFFLLANLATLILQEKTKREFDGRSTLRTISFHLHHLQYGGFLEWGYPQMDGL